MMVLEQSMQGPFLHRGRKENKDMFPEVFLAHRSVRPAKSVEVADKTQNAVFYFASNMQMLEPNRPLVKACR